MEKCVAKSSSIVSKNRKPPSPSTTNPTKKQKTAPCTTISKGKLHHSTSSSTHGTHSASDKVNNRQNQTPAVTDLCQAHLTKHLFRAKHQIQTNWKKDYAGDTKHFDLNKYLCHQQEIVQKQSKTKKLLSRKAGGEGQACKEVWQGDF